MIKQNPKEFFRNRLFVESKEHLSIKIKLLEDFKRVRFYLHFEYNTSSNVDFLKVKNFNFLKQENQHHYFKNLYLQDFAKIKNILLKYSFYFKLRILREIRKEASFFFEKEKGILFTDCSIYFIVDKIITKLRKEILETIHWLWKESSYGHRRSIFSPEDLDFFYSKFKYVNFQNPKRYKNFLYPFWDI